MRLISKILVCFLLSLDFGLHPVLGQREMKRLQPDSSASITLFINAASNVLETDSKKFSPAQVSIPAGKYRVTAKVDAFFAGKTLPVRKVVFSTLSFSDPAGYTWTIRDGEEFDITITPDNNLYGYFVDTYTPDNTGGAILTFTRLD